MMDAYFDAGVIVKLYVQERTSPDAIRLVSAHAPPYLLTQWQVLEVKNAIRLKAFRREITQAEMTQSVTAFEQDIVTGRWQRPAYTAAAVVLWLSGPRRLSPSMPDNVRWPNRPA